MRPRGWSLEDAEQRELLRVARSAIEAALGQREGRQESVSDGGSSGAPWRQIPHPKGASSEDLPPGLPADPLSQPWGAFVSIHVDGELRGCIGMIEPRGPLRETVRECAVASALHDSRFPPLRTDELRRAHLEISVLSPSSACHDPSLIEIGRHGLIISRGSNRGLLLPQVAVDEGWDRDTFLDQACRKAGLRAGEWRTGATIETFEAFVFTES